MLQLSAIKMSQTTSLLAKTERGRERERERESGGPFQQIFASLVLKLEEDTFLKWAIPSLFFFFSSSVTRFGEILPLWQLFEGLFFIFGIILNVFWQILYAFGPFCIDVKVQKLNIILAIWSHCFRLSNS